MSSDQAAGLRDWASKNKPPESAATAENTLVVVGLPSKSNGDTQPVREQLARLAELGRRWVGNPQAWELIPAEYVHTDMQELASRFPRWALWVEPDTNGFQRAYNTMRNLHVNGGPQRVLLLHPPVVSTRGLINNVRECARNFFNLDLICVQYSNEGMNTDIKSGQRT
ncbi:hypothetical protein CWE08_00800 [Aliidiomarina iranensis]|uniref:Uncharacterized protein n=1 Tax=Aliidiomarina iranensis TaxID=1434071 RepID=A0A432W1X4_9GAMM|nr:hypothetical protein [Aliidiomarina iranensis]RUO23225.1 hypothetical protein CWE08_00800 [Aliidiomarina iranensis]